MFAVQGPREHAHYGLIVISICVATSTPRISESGPVITTQLRTSFSEQAEVGHHLHDQKIASPEKTASRACADVLGRAKPTISRTGTHDISFDEAQPVLQAFSDDLPADLQHLSAERLKQAWPDYVLRHDSETRKRLLQGDEDSLVNLLLFGTSFTAQPRITKEFNSQVEQQLHSSASERPEKDPLFRALEVRTSDLIAALAAPGKNERLEYMRQLLEHKRLTLGNAAARERVRKYLVVAVERVRSEFAEYHKAIESARATGDASTEFAVRSTLYQKRGISLDTSIMPDFALEEALKLMLDRGLLAKGSVRRVAVIGPGLDFTDKQEGYDFYPQQTTQPFALIDSLLRLGLSREEDLEITSLDISSRVNQHLAHIRQRAQQGLSYVLQLPLRRDKSWDPGAKAFWEHLGELIGSPTEPVAVPVSAGKLDIRAVRIRPEVVLRIVPRDANVVWQRLQLPSDRAYDLVVATNILVYYDEFQQALALDNLQSMIRENGFLLTNNGLPEVSTLRMKQAGYSSTAYSDRAADGDHIIWYRRSAN